MKPFGVLGAPGLTWGREGEDWEVMEEMQVRRGVFSVGDNGSARSEGMGGSAEGRRNSRARKLSASKGLRGKEMQLTGSGTGLGSWGSEYSPPQPSCLRPLYSTAGGSGCVAASHGEQQRNQI